MLDFRSAHWTLLDAVGTIRACDEMTAREKDDIAFFGVADAARNLFAKALVLLAQHFSFDAAIIVTTVFNVVNVLATFAEVIIFWFFDAFV